MKIKIKTFEEWKALQEQSVAMYGDWSPSKDRIAEKSNRALKTDWDFVEPLIIGNEKYNLYKFKTRSVFILGNRESDTDPLTVVFQIELTEQKAIEHMFKGRYKNIVNVDGVIVKDTSRGNGLATYMYQYLTKSGYTILGDEYQYHKARLLWAKLSKLDNCTVDIIDVLENKIIEENVNLYHGELDWEFDERVWSYDMIKSHIRLILKEVK